MIVTRSISILLSTAVALAVATASAALGDIYNSPSLAEARQLAAARGVPVLVHLYRPGSGACRQFAREAKTDSQVTRSLRRASLCHVDATTPEGRRAADLYGVSRYPAIVLTNSVGEVLAQWVGYRRMRFLRTMDEALRDLSTLAEKAERHRGAANPADAACLGRIHASRGEHEKAVEFYRAAESMDPKSVSILACPIFDSVWQDRTRHTYIELKAVADSVLNSGSDIALEIVDVCIRMAGWARSSGRMDQAAHYLRAGIRAADGSREGNLDALGRVMRSDLALYVDQDTLAAASNMKAAFPPDWESSRTYLMAYSNWCLSNGINTEEAERYAQKAIDAGNPGTEKALGLYHHVQSLAGAGEYGAALMTLEMVLAADPANRHFPSMLDGIRSLVEYQ